MAPSTGKNVIIKIHSILFLPLSLLTSTSVITIIHNAITVNNIRRKNLYCVNTSIIKNDNGYFDTKHLIIDILICHSKSEFLS